MNFNDASKAAARWLKSQRQRGSLQLLSKPSGESESTKDHTFVDTLLDIGEETALLAETKDIRDELNMISMVLKHQVSILDDMMHALLEEARGSDSRMQSEIKKRYREQHKVVEVHLKDVERMDKQAEGIYTSVCLIVVGLHGELLTSHCSLLTSLISNKSTLTPLKPDLREIRPLSLVDKVRPSWYSQS